MTMLMTSCMFLLLYGYVTFQNGIDLNELTIKFSMLFFITWILTLIFIKLSPLIKSNFLKALIVCILSLQVITLCYEALTADTKQIEAMHRKISLMLGNSVDYQELNILYQDIESLKVLGDTRRGNFNKPLDFVVELEVKNQEKPYYFMCKGTGPYCNELKLVENPTLH